VTVDRKQAIAETFDAVSGSYGVTGPDFFWPLGRALVESAGIAAGERILDVACGTGAVSSAAAEAGARVTAIDMAPAMVETARRNGVDAHVMDAEQLGFPDESFDHVLCGFALFFLPDPGRALGEWRRVLRPGGRLALSAFAGWDPRWQWIEEFTPERLKRPPGTMFSSEEELEDVLSPAGFEEVRFELASHDLVFADADEWWAWTWAHGRHAILSRMTEDELAAYRAGAAERIAAMAPAVNRISARFAFARRP
jgi:SAM-dependent methyltransferase